AGSATASPPPQPHRLPGPRTAPRLVDPLRVSPRRSPPRGRRGPVAPSSATGRDRRILGAPPPGPPASSPPEGTTRSEDRNDRTQDIGRAMAVEGRPRGRLQTEAPDPRPLPGHRPRNLRGRGERTDHLRGRRQARRDPRARRPARQPRGYPQLQLHRDRADAARHGRARRAPQEPLARRGGGQEARTRPAGGGRGESGARRQYPETPPDPP